MSTPIDTALRSRGILSSEVATSLGVVYETVRLWRAGQRALMPKLALEIERKFGIPRHELLPDIWPPPPVRTRARRRETADTST